MRSALFVAVMKYVKLVYIIQLIPSLKEVLRCIRLWFSCLECTVVGVFESLIYLQMEKSFFFLTSTLFETGLVSGTLQLSFHIQLI
jgi:hypothetical protein